MLFGCVTFGVGFGKRACAFYCVPVCGFARCPCVGVQGCVPGGCADYCVVVVQYGSQFFVEFYRAF